MTAAPSLTEHDAVVRRINETLQGPVIDVLARLVPEVAALPRHNALELILDDVDLLHRCFVAFRTNIGQFRHLLVGPRGTAVDDAETELQCGRSLDKIEAMVVRTAAKRHFRRRLDHDHRGLRGPPRRHPRDDSGVFARLRALLSRRPLRPVRPKSRADLLYEAIAPLLAHDWQLPLVPEYSRLSAPLVRRLGKRLLDYRVPEDVRRLKLEPDRLPPPTSVELMEYLGAGVFGLPPIVPPTTQPRVADVRTGTGIAPAPALEPRPVDGDRRAPVAALTTADGTRLRAEAFAPLLMDPKLLAVLPGTAHSSLKPGAVLSAAGAQMAGRLVDALGLTTEQLAVFLVTAHARLGERHFQVAFGSPGRPDYIDRIIARARAAGITQHSPLADVARFVAGLFATT